jgi:hypothetical protein
MGLFAQGTVQLWQQKGSLKIRINPTETYKVRHNAKDYTVFLEDLKADEKAPGPRSRVLSVETDFSVDGPARSLLTAAACNSVKIEIEISKDGDAKVIGVRVPAPPSST